VIKSYRDLAIWKRSMDLALECYRVTGEFPSSEVYGLTAQIRRAAASIPANIAEGRGRRTTRDFLRFLGIAHGSLLELETHVILAQRLGYCASTVAVPILRETGELGRMLNGMHRTLSERMRRRDDSRQPCPQPEP
jgi:four helix bundle protein